jgi:acetolactate synthase-1/2/3 large subunit
MLARGQGATGFGPVRDPGELVRVLRSAIETVEGGGVALVDVRVEPGYATSMGAHYARR